MRDRLNVRMGGTAKPQNRSVPEGCFGAPPVATNMGKSSIGDAVIGGRPMRTDFKFRKIDK